jgi:ubiquinone/menaquinone biosynthesis C-methylase UbiE
MPKEMAIEGTHDTVLKFVVDTFKDRKNTKILDIGAGQGSLSLKLKNAGYDVYACDIDAGNFLVADVEFKQVDANGALPYEDGSFDLILSIEVIEHIENHRSFFSEARRVLKPNGRYIFSTPNILSLKYRLGYLFTGYGYSFGPLEPFVQKPATQHISPFTLDRYTWMLSVCGLEIETFRTDKLQSSSKLWYFLAPLIRFLASRKHGTSESIQRQNSKVALLGRKLFVMARKVAQA